MLNNTGIFGLLFFMITQVSAQKIIEKSWNAEIFTKVEIISDEVFSIEIVSETSETIHLTTTIEGEFSENIVIETRENTSKGILELSTGYSPYFRMKNDKLAAHKVHAIEMKLHLPPNMAVYVRSALATVAATGTFRNLELKLEDGNCLLNDFEGNTSLSTKNGNITVYCKNMGIIRANTTHGTLTNGLPAGERYSLKAESVNGDITLLPSQ